MKRLLAIVLIIIALLTFIVLPAIAATYATGTLCAKCGRASAWKKCSGREYRHISGTCSASPNSCAVLEYYYATRMECDYGCTYTLYEWGTDHLEYQIHSVCSAGMPIGSCEIAYTH